MNGTSPSPELRPPAPETVRQKFLRDPGPWIILLAGLALWRAGYPRPHVDDLFFTGVSIELTRSGQLVNPWLAPWMASIGTTQFFVFPPVLPYTQGLWVACFGVSTASFTAFHLLVQGALQLCVYRLARAAGAGWHVALAAAVVAFFFSVNYGMRPDALAFLLVVLGQLGAHGSRPWHRVAGAVLSAAAVLTHPLAMAFVIPLYVGQLLTMRGNRPALRTLVVSTSAGVAATFLWFLVAIHGAVGEFLRAMAAHKRLIMAPDWYRGPLYFWGELVLGREPWLCGTIYVLAFLGFARAFRAATSDGRMRTYRRLVWIWLAAAAMGSFLYPGRMEHYAAYSGLALAVVIWSNSRWAGAVASAAVIAAAAHNAGAVLVPAFGDTTPPDPVAIRDAVARHPERILCVDEVVARYVFDFRLPAGARDWSLRRPAQLGTAGTIASKSPGTLWIASEWKLEHYVADAGVRAERLRIGSHTFGSLARVPYRVRIIE